MKNKVLQISYVLVVMLLVGLFFVVNYQESIDNQEKAKTNLEQLLIPVVEYKYDSVGDLYEYLTELDVRSGVRFSLYDSGEMMFDSRSFIKTNQIADRSLFSDFSYLNPETHLYSVDQNTFISTMLKLSIEGKEYEIQASSVYDEPFSPRYLIDLGFTIIIITLGYMIALKRSNKKTEDFIAHTKEEVAAIIENRELAVDHVETELTHELFKIANYIGAINKKYDFRKGQLISILSSLNIGILAIDLDGKIMLSNKRFNEMFQVNLVDGKEVYHSIFHKNVLEVLEQSGTEQIIEQHYVEQSNGLIFNFKGIPINTKQRRIGTLIVVEDVTKTSKLDKMKQEFVSNVTHELKTPLTSIQGFADTLTSMDPNNPKFKDFLNIISMEVSRLNDLINDILVLSEVENKGFVSSEQIDINRVSREVIDLIQINKDKDVQLSIEANRNYFVTFDRHKLKQLILNLVSNAYKYTDKGSVQIKIQEDRGHVVLKVIDTGIGIPMEEQGRIFERFYRVDKARARETGGTGLGLSIVKHIVDAGEATITLESESGKGTTFTVTFKK